MSTLRPTMYISIFSIIYKISVNQELKCHRNTDLLANVVYSFIYTPACPMSVCFFPLVCNGNSLHYIISLCVTMLGWTRSLQLHKSGDFSCGRTCEYTLAHMYTQTKLSENSAQITLMNFTIRLWIQPSLGWLYMNSTNLC